MCPKYLILGYTGSILVVADVKKHLWVIYWISESISTFYISEKISDEVKIRIRRL